MAAKIKTILRNLRAENERMRALAETVIRDPDSRERFLIEFRLVAFRHKAQAAAEAIYADIEGTSPSRAVNAFRARQRRYERRYAPVSVLYGRFLARGGGYSRAMARAMAGRDHRNDPTTQKRNPKRQVTTDTQSTVRMAPFYAAPFRSIATLLTADEYELARLLYNDDMTNDEAAQVMGVSVRTIKARHRRLRDKLRQSASGCHVVFEF
jgi:predicted DNA-binding protein (UPF0251 family)